MAEKIDLHMHTNVSDGSDTPAEILGHVRDAGVTVFSVTDHDAIKSSSMVKGLLRDGDPAFICGVEFSCKDSEGQYHVLGYAYDPDSASINDVVDKGHSLRMKKVKARLDFIRDEFGFVFPEDEIEQLLKLDNPGKPHIANMMIRHGYADNRQTAIHEYIDRIHFRSEYVRPEEAIAGILGAGGIPVLAHPFFGSGDQLILGEDMENRLRRLIGYGLKGVEAFYSGFSPKLVHNMLELADR
ncbi:MAG: hypothetical protein Q4G47_02210, partial [Lachnospiraceae bacterium]|nr:hypothetical protein [Lachnospiraceae bacterium]